MKLNRFIICAFILLLNFNSFGQKRIGVDVSTRLDNLILTIHYQKVLKNKLLYSVGLYAGNYGRATVRTDSAMLYGGNPIRTPYESANFPISDSITTYSLQNYETIATGFGIQIGLGYFFEFGTKHGLRTNLNSRIGYAYSYIKGYYRSTANNTGKFEHYSESHLVSSISMEIFHTIRLTDITTFNYGVKVPYFYLVNREKFDPDTKKDLLYGFEPEVSLGLTRIIGKCD